MSTSATPTATPTVRAVTLSEILTRVDSRSISVMSEILENIKVLDMDIKPEDYVNFGKMDSNTYRQEFLKLAMIFNLPLDAMLVIIGLSVVMKNKPRILATLDRDPKFRTYPWFRSVYDFISEKMVQYVVDSAKGFPMVKLPESFPSLAAVMWFVFTPENDYKPKNFMGTLFMGSINLDIFSQKIHMNWEREFWDTIVLKSRNRNRDKEVKLGFNPDFYTTKANDKYPLLNLDGTVFQNGGPYNMEALFKYFMTMTMAIRHSTSRVIQNLVRDLESRVKSDFLKKHNLELSSVLHSILEPPFPSLQVKIEQLEGPMESHIDYNALMTLDASSSAAPGPRAKP